MAKESALKALKTLSIVVIIPSQCILIYYLHYSCRQIDISPIGVKELSASANKRKQWAKSRISVDGCGAGHVAALPPVCGNDDCLPVLPPSYARTIVSPMPADLRHKVAVTPGWLHIRNVDIVYHLTRAQRELGVWGSVGEIGVYYGRYTQVLAHWLDTASGERLFVCDIFGDKRHMFNTELARREKFDENMKNVGMSIEHEDEARRVRVFSNSSLYLSKATLVKMGVPAFRFLSLDGNHNLPFPLADLVTCSCLARPGAILAMDDVFNKRWPDVGKGLNQFFRHYGDNIWRPLVAIGNKLYLVTTDWHGKYVAWIKQNWPGIKGIKQVNMNLVKKTYTYWRIM